MKTAAFSLALVAIAATHAPSQEAPPLAQPQQQTQAITLQQAVDLAQKQGNQSAAAIATRDAARADADAFSARRLPQVSFAGTAPRYEKTITPVVQQDGTTQFIPVQVTNADAGLTVSQQLPFTGGNFSVTSLLTRYEVSGGSERTLRWTSSPVTFAIQQPILRPNALRWNARLQDAELDAAERQYLEDREGVAVDATTAFFDLFIARRQMENAASTAATNDTLFLLNKGRLEVGKIGENDLLQSELALLRARAQADAARLDYQRALAAFRLAVNLPSDAPVTVEAPVSVPDFEPDTAVAAAQALRNRARISALALADIQARRSIAEARLQGGPGATLNASLGFNQTADQMNLAYQDLLQAQRFSLQLSVPLLNWGARSADVQVAKATQRRVDANSRQTREQVRQEGHFAALQLSQARRNLAVSAKADTVAQKRFEVAYNRYVIGRIGIDNLYIAQSEKDGAVNQYLQALKSYWLSYYRLRQLTLYDFEQGQVIR